MRFLYFAVSAIFRVSATSDGAEKVGWPLWFAERLGFYDPRYGDDSEVTSEPVVNAGNARKIDSDDKKQEEGPISREDPAVSKSNESNKGSVKEEGEPRENDDPYNSKLVPIQTPSEATTMNVQGEGGGSTVISKLEEKEAGKDPMVGDDGLQGRNISPDSLKPADAQGKASKKSWNKLISDAKNGWSNMWEKRKKWWRRSQFNPNNWSNDKGKK